MRRISILFAVLLLGCLPTRSSQAAQPCFPDVPTMAGCIAEPFATYWQDNGALPVFGYPITVAEWQRNPDLNTLLLTQWTERNRLEIHPQNPAPYTVLLGRMGAERLAQLGRNPAAEGREAGPQAGCVWFAETGHNVCDQAAGVGFKSYWQAHGLAIPGLSAYERSLQLFGLPLTAPQTETNAAGDTVLTQWFERARFEWHPGNPDEFKVLLGLLGVELRAAATNLPTGLPTSVYGVEIGRGRVAKVVDKARQLPSAWVRYHGISWAAVEATPGVYDWSVLADVERDLQTLAAAGLNPLVIIRTVPRWAQAKAGVSCGAIADSALDDFARFVGAVVTRYSQAPYNVHFWEMGNEPDVDPTLVSPDSVFGCWGDIGDPYYGGGAYAAMLKQVYPAVKAADSWSQVVIGGLLLDSPNTTNPALGKPERFLEGILRAGGGQSFDIVAYHAYTYWNAKGQDWDINVPGWNSRGGALVGKYRFLRDVLDRYNATQPIMMNEGGLLCYRSSSTCADSAVFRQDQANYALRMYTRAWANGLIGALWYTLDGPGWQQSGLLDAAQAPRPAFTTVQFLAARLDQAIYVGRADQGAAEGYLFRNGATTYAIYWTNDRATSASITLPADTRAIYALDGTAQSVNDTSYTVGFEPIIVEYATR